ncbi:Transcription factor atf21 [Fusarium albosuccineum]|uniref:Transcription factor atf21 n=1 Tax=Fusarium albosuccineum TaxID=1237068 RepID=A0A8H4L740_9HYPO|nr:Transcription factor atf21 [Fusarium albosuccineum]
MATTPSPGYMMTPSPYYTRTPSPTDRSNMAYQPLPSQVPDASFFEEAIGGSPTPQDMAFGIIQGPSQYSITPKIPISHDSPQRIVTTVEADQKPIRRARNRRQSQASSSISEETNGSAVAPESPKPKKRGRKPKSEQKEAGKGRQKVELDEDDLPKDPRRRRILERNRIAATKCRLRKRDEASALASREQAMEDQNRYLSSCFDALTAEIYHLKTQLLQHTDCNCVLIQKYIANEAKKTVDGLLSCSSAFQMDHDSMSECRQGSSNSGTSPTESLGVPTPEFEGVSPTWSHPFQQGPASSEVGEDMFDMTMDQYNKGAMAMAGQHISNITSLPHTEPEMFVGMGPQPQHVDGISWDPSWGFR